MSKKPFGYQILNSLRCIVAIGKDWKVKHLRQMKVYNHNLIKIRSKYLVG